MKLFAIGNVNFFLLILMLFCSCQQENTSVDLLKQAQSVVEDNPAEALVLLDSILNPKEIGTDCYMQYIVVRVQAKYKTYQDITADTLIFEAQKYFSDKHDYNNAAIACNAAGDVYYEQKQYDRAMECYLQARTNAKHTSNNLMTGRIFHNIAFLFFEEDLLHEAIDNYHRALEYYKKEQDTDFQKIQALRYIGWSYVRTNEADSALLYLEEGLDLAKKTGNKAYQATLSHFRGMAYRELGDYNQAAADFHKAQAQTSNPEESLRINLSLSILYDITNQSDSVNYYNNILTNRINEVTDNYVLESIYGTLSKYQEKTGNYQQALYYSELEKEAGHRIRKSKYPRRLLDVNEDYAKALLKKENDNLRMRSYFLYTCAIILIISILLITYFRIRNIRKKQRQKIEKAELLQKQAETQNKVLEAQNECLKVEGELYNEKAENLEFIQSIYRNIATEWSTIDKEVKLLTKEYGVRKQPALYARISEFVESVKQNTNQQLMEWVRDYFLKKPYGQKAIELLNDRDLSLFLFCYCGYDNKEITVLLDVSPMEQYINHRKFGLRNKLEKAGMSKCEIDRILFPDKIDNTLD